jgi:hypothetical protein
MNLTLGEQAKSCSDKFEKDLVLNLDNVAQWTIKKTKNKL